MSEQREGAARSEKPELLKTIRVRPEFHAWLKRASHAEGKWLSRLLEDAFALKLGGKRPWDVPPPEPAI